MTTQIKILTVTDLHQSRTLYEQLRKAVERHTPEVVTAVGDFIDYADDKHHELSKAQCALLLSSLPCAEVVLTRGNHEDQDWRLFAQAWRSTKRPLRALNAEPFVFGPLVLVAFPCTLGQEGFYLDGRQPVPRDVSTWFAPILRRFGLAALVLWLMHQPPAGTRLSAETGPMAGVLQWTAAIERSSPLLTISGHDHETPLRHHCWHERVRQTTCVNVGQKLDGPLHYCLVEIEFKKPVPSRPSRLRVTALPWNQTVDVLGDNSPVRIG
jgi:Icc-related predicted phosphoesterase